MARIAGINIAPHKHAEIALTGIYGIGRITARKICADTGIKPDTKIKDLTEAEVEAIIADMLAAWLSGDDASLLRLFEVQAGNSELSRAFNTKLLDERNVTMAQTIRRYLAGSGTYFVLIGAGHFVGDQGIISLLGRQGVRGRRITSDTQLSHLN